MRFVTKRLHVCEMPSRLESKTGVNARPASTATVETTATSRLRRATNGPRRAKALGLPQLGRERAGGLAATLHCGYIDAVAS